MSEPTRSEIERRALAILEQLAGEPVDPVLLDRLLAGEDAAVAARVRSISGRSQGVDAMPTDIAQTMAGTLTLDPPERFGPFRIVAPIGRGGMGEVWRGERDDGLFDQVVAIKLIQPHLQVRAGEAFESERRILAGLEHPNIARLIDGGTTAEGRACLVMEFVDGVPFDAGCAALPLERQVQLFRQALSAVGYAHGRLIAHGDLKPSNILVDRDDRVRLLDFGIARLVTDAANAFRLTGAVTSSFASPARLAGQPPSIPDDVFALGRLLTRVIVDAADPDLAAIAAKASAPDEARRYGSVPELVADLDRWSRRYPVSAVPRTGLYVARRYVRRNWQGLLAALLLAGALGYTAYSYLQAQRERAEASARFDDARGTARYLLFTLYDQLAAHPNTLALRRDVAATAQRYLDRLATSRSSVPEVRLEAAQGLLRLADVQGSPGMASLGDGGGSRRNIETAIRLLRGETAPTARRALFGAWLDSAFLAQNGESDEKRAGVDLAAAKAILETEPGLPAYDRARYWLARSSVDRWESRNALAIAEADKAIALLHEDECFETLKLRSKAFERKGDALFYLHRGARAIASYRAAVVPLERAVALRPGNMEAHRRLAHIRWNLATALMDDGDPHEALALLESAQAQIRIAMAFDPSDDDAKRRFDMFEQSRGETLLILGKVDEGFAIMARMTDAYKQSWLKNPSDNRALRNYAVTLTGLADQQGKHQRYAQACPNWREYLQLYGVLEARGHVAQEDRENGIALARENIAKHCR